MLVCAAVVRLPISELKPPRVGPCWHAPPMALEKPGDVYAGVEEDVVPAIDVADFRECTAPLLGKLPDGGLIFRARRVPVGTQQNADKFRACARASSASAAPPASGIAPVRVWPTVNVHPPCPVVKTPANRFSEPG